MKKQMIILCILTAFLTVCGVQAQVKISDKTEAIDYADVQGALMQFQSKDSNKGVRLPQVVLADMDRYQLGGVDKDVYDSAAGMMVFHLGDPNNDYPELINSGIKVWDGEVWYSTESYTGNLGGSGWGEKYDTIKLVARSNEWIGFSFKSGGQQGCYTSEKFVLHLYFSNNRMYYSDIVSISHTGGGCNGQDGSTPGIVTESYDAGTNTLTIDVTNRFGMGLRPRYSFKYDATTNELIIWQGTTAGFIYHIGRPFKP